jgi:hypothetical protein
MRYSYVAVALVTVAACRTVEPPPPPAPRIDPSPAPSPEAVSFDASVKPLLARTCTPCHVPGGRMYERMPFDRPEVVFAHKEGVLRRMKNPDDRQVLERWFAQTKS